MAAFTAAGIVPVGSPAAAAQVAGAGRPVVAKGADGTVTVFVRNSDDTVYRRVRIGGNGEWRDWADTGGAAVGDPAVGHNLDGRQELFARRSDGHLWHQFQSRKGGWSPWQDLDMPTGTTLAGDPVVVADDNTATVPNPDPQGHVTGNTDGRLEVFALGGDGQIWHRAQSAPNGPGWTAWEQLTGMSGTWVGTPAVVVAGDGRIAVLARSQDGHLEQSAQLQPSTPQTPLPSTNWSAWYDLGAGYTGDPVLAAYTTGNGTLLQAFAHHGGQLRTVTQSAPGTAASPTGTWDLNHSKKLGKALHGKPVVAANTDGRLAVFGLNAKNQVIYRSQTDTATPGTNPNGIWEGGWATLDKGKASSVAVLRTGTGTFDAFTVAKASTRLLERGQLAAGIPTSPRGVWLEPTDLAAIGSDNCAAPGSLACLNIDNVDLGLAVDLQDPTDSSSYIVRSAPDPSRQEWALRTDPTSNTGAFSMVNGNGKCIGEKSEFLGPWHLHLADCATGDTSQQWYLEPVTPTTDAAPTSYRIRQVSSGTCLTALKYDYVDAGGAVHNSKQLERIDCQTTDANFHNTWKLGRGAANAPGVLNVALAYAAQKCAADQKTNTCTFVDVTPTSAYQSSAGCVVGTVLYNQSDSKAEYEASVTHETGSEWSVGGSLTIPVKALEVGFDTSHTWIQTTRVEEKTKVEVPPKMFGWVEHAPVVRETIGYWKITLGGRSWTVPGHNLSYAQDGTDNVNSITVAKTASAPPIAAQCKL
jgi:hypothetical protein